MSSPKVGDEIIGKTFKWSCGYMSGTLFTIVNRLNDCYYGYYHGNVNTVLAFCDIGCDSFYVQSEELPLYNSPLYRAMSEKETK